MPVSRYPLLFILMCSRNSSFIEAERPSSDCGTQRMQSTYAISPHTTRDQHFNNGGYRFAPAINGPWSTILYLFRSLVTQPCAMGNICGPLLPMKLVAAFQLRGSNYDYTNAGILPVVP
ncbi:hypothetical protein BGW80DRAFT_883756 [Lactifluus volemus]|nr:hypothetical protein BGW80DRAFT_883756 [Lactifluus volemus]